MTSKTRRLARSIGALVTAAILAGGLAACSTGGASSSCDPAATAGDASETVTAAEQFGTQPTVSFATPLRPATTQVSTLIEGTGAPIVEGQYVSTFLTILNGTDGTILSQSTYSADEPASFVIDQLGIEGFKKGMQCAKVDSRIAIVVPGSEAFTDDNRPTGLDPDDSIVLVVDITAAYLAKAQGTLQFATSGLPAVLRAPDGRPGVQIPTSSKPTDLKVVDLIRGDKGQVVKDGDTVVVQYTGVLWDTASVFDSSWEKGSPVTVTAADGQAIPGFVKALVGQHVGSQVLAVLPPSEGYGDQASGSIPANSTLVFVIDVLGVVG